MKIFLKLFARSIPRYKGYLAIYILFLVLSNVLGLFGFAAIIPILRILFGLSDADLKSGGFEQCDTLEEYVNVLENNFFYYLQNQIVNHGTIWVLSVLCMFVVGVSLLSNVTSYFAYYFRYQFVQVFHVILERNCIEKSSICQFGILIIMTKETLSLE